MSKTITKSIDVDVDIDLGDEEILEKFSAEELWQEIKRRDKEIVIPADAVNDSMLACYRELRKLPALGPATRAYFGDVHGKIL